MLGFAHDVARLMLSARHRVSHIVVMSCRATSVYIVLVHNVSCRIFLPEAFFAAPGRALADVGVGAGGVSDALEWRGGEPAVCFERLPPGTYQQH